MNNEERRRYRDDRRQNERRGNDDENRDEENPNPDQIRNDDGRNQRDGGNRRGGGRGRGRGNPHNRRSLADKKRCRGMMPFQFIIKYAIVKYWNTADQFIDMYPVLTPEKD